MRLRRVARQVEGPRAPSHGPGARAKKRGRGCGVDRPDRRADYPLWILEADNGSEPASLYVLLALADRPSHGLGVAKNVAEFTDGLVLLGPGTLYRCLKDLASAGLVERVGPPDSDNPHRKYYGLTPKGTGELSNAVQELTRVTATAESRLGRLVPKEA